MSNREKIILVAMVVAILYGVYSLFFDTPRKTQTSGSAKSIEEINRFVADMSLKLTQKEDRMSRYILSQAENEWGGDPFVELKPSPVKVEVATKPVAKKPEPEEQFAYTGYLQMGDLTIAIIDGLEYELGDELARSGFVVKQIDPKRVLIGPPERNNNRTILLNETK